MKLRIKEHLFDIRGITIAQTYLQIKEETNCDELPPSFIGVYIVCLKNQLHREVSTFAV